MADGHVVGHILFTAVSITGAGRPIAASILAPMAVLPEAQRKGYGSRLAEDGLKRLAASGRELVFVLGHPAFYPRFGFEPALPLGFAPPFPIASDHAAAWMVLALSGGVIGPVSGRVRCADALSRPELWPG